MFWCLAVAALPWTKVLAHFGAEKLKACQTFARNNVRRVAVTTAYLAVSLLLTWIWIVSYRWNDTIQGVLGTQRIQFASDRGLVSMYVFPERNSPNFPDRSWIHQRQTSPPDLNEWGRSWAFHKILPAGIYLAVPHWPAVLIVTVIAAAPWLHKINFPRRFSLRFLLIVTTLFAIALGLLFATTK
jgi:hypothetical protein